MSFSIVITCDNCRARHELPLAHPESVKAAQGLLSEVYRLGPHLAGCPKCDAEKAASYESALNRATRTRSRLH